MWQDGGCSPLHLEHTSHRLQNTANKKILPSTRQRQRQMQGRKKRRRTLLKSRGMVHQRGTESCHRLIGSTPQWQRRRARRGNVATTSDGPNATQTSRLPLRSDDPDDLMSCGCGCGYFFTGDGDGEESRACVTCQRRRRSLCFRRRRHGQLFRGPFLWWGRNASCAIRCSPWGL